MTGVLNNALWMNHLERWKQQWAYHGALRVTTVHLDGPECSPPICTLQTRLERHTSIHRTMTSPRPKDFIFDKRNLSLTQSIPSRYLLIYF